MLAGLLAACGNSSSTPSAPPIGKLVVAVLAAADKVTAPWRCAAADTPLLADEDIKTGHHTWKTTRNVLRRVGDHESIVIGVIADAGGAAPRTIAALGRMRAALDAAKPDLLLVLGGMGATADELQATLGTLADRASWPVIALPGDLEAMAAHTAALATLRKRGDAVLDGRNVRWIEVEGAVIATLPGAGAVERLASESDGCVWTADDVARVTSELTVRPGIRIVATTEAPRHTLDGEAVGELALVPSKAFPVDVALHGPVEPTPSPARTGARDGAGVQLSPGTVDATSRLPHSDRPSAGVLTVRGGAWSWRPIVDTKRDDR